MADNSAKGLDQPHHTFESEENRAAKHQLDLLATFEQTTLEFPADLASHQQLITSGFGDSVLCQFDTSASGENIASFDTVDIEANFEPQPIDSIEAAVTIDAIETVVGDMPLDEVDRGDIELVEQHTELVEQHSAPHENTVAESGEQELVANQSVGESEVPSEYVADEPVATDDDPLGEPHQIVAELVGKKKKKRVEQEPVEVVDPDFVPDESEVISAKKLKRLKRDSERAAAAADVLAKLKPSAPRSGESDSVPALDKVQKKIRVQLSNGDDTRDIASRTVDTRATNSRVDHVQVDDAVEVPIRFSDLPLREEVLQAVAASGYENPTPIQAQIIPHMLAGSDLLAQSQTGTGKTAAFALPILSKLDLKREPLPQALVLAPTRELAIQVAKSFETYAEKLRNFSVCAIYGGQDYEIQFRQLRRGPQVVVGTPGRIIDHINRGTLDLSSIETLVLDEADEMLNMGFLEDVQFVLEQTPPKRQIALFSATLPDPIKQIAERYLHDPVKISIKKKTLTADSIRQRALILGVREKMDALCRFLEVEETDGVIVFTKTRDATIAVAEALNNEGLSAIALNGDMPQKVRERAIDQLKSGQLNILVATDVAARGLDVRRVSHVFNFDLPHDSESYIHRVGRTGRAGRAGEAIIFLTPAQRGKLRLIEKATKQTIELVQPPTADEINASRIARFTQRITEAIGGRDLTVYKNLIAQYAEESGKPLELIAAALADMTHQGRPFLVKDRPKSSRREYSEQMDDDSRGGRNNRRGSNDDSGDFADGGRRSSNARRIGPPEAGMKRFRAEIGRRDGVRPGNIVGAIANEAGIDGEFIGPIQILDSYSTIDLPDNLPSELLHTLRSAWVLGKQLRLAPLERESRPQRPGSRPQSGERNTGGTFESRDGATGVPPKRRNYPAQSSSTEGGRSNFPPKSKKPKGPKPFGKTNKGKRKKS